MPQKHKEVDNQTIGIGPTFQLNLRVSVATLSRVIFPRPGDGVPMLALEHKATLKSESQVIVKTQPLGGAVRILNSERILAFVGSFNFDSERSRSERDFRIYIRPSSWEALRDFCLGEMSLETSSDLENNPYRELAEEFDDALGIQLNPNQFTLKSIGIVLENKPAPTTNLHATGHPTVRIYRVDEVQIQDPNLCKLMMTNSENHSSLTLQRLVLEDARKGGQGRANTMFAAPVEKIRTTILAVPLEKRGEPLFFEGTFLDGNVAALFNDIPVQKYSNLGE